MDQASGGAETRPETETLVAHVAIFGTFVSMGGFYSTTPERGGEEILVQYHLPDKLKLVDGTEFDMNDCTLFEVHHRAVPVGKDICDLDVSRKFLNKTLEAISELLLWVKAHESVQQGSSYNRQVGTADVKVFLLMKPGARQQVVMVHRNIRERFMLRTMAGIYSGVRVLPSPAEKPLSPLARRGLATIDLFNLGFHTEAFLVSFTLLDDLTQGVVKAGLQNRGMDAEEQNRLTRAIEKERLDRYMNLIFKLCGWKALAEDDPDLWKRLRAVNTLRNKVAHNGRTLHFEEAADSVDTLWDTIRWLAKNPFGFQVPVTPPMTIIQPHWHLLDLDAPAEASPAQQDSENASNRS